MDADSRYAMLYAMGDHTFDVEASEKIYQTLFSALPICPLRTPSSLWLRRQLDTGSVKPKIYRVFDSHENAMIGETALATFRCAARLTAVPSS